jgi:hypothetical protein
MGNYLLKATSKSFPCQSCGDVFQKEIEGSLPCKECRINNKFELLSELVKQNCLFSYVVFPTYSFIKNKTPPILVVEDTFDIDFIKNMKENINILSTHPVTRKHYCLIKSIIQYLYRSIDIIHT